MELNRTAEQWQKCDPKSMAKMSEAAIMYALADARSDVLKIHAEIERLRGLGDEPMRVIAVEAIREVTGCPDIKGNDKSLVDVLMEKVRDFVTPNA